MKWENFLVIYRKISIIIYIYQMNKILDVMEDINKTLQTTNIKLLWIH
jgi:hypothetical protein